MPLYIDFIFLAFSKATVLETRGLLFLQSYRQDLSLYPFFVILRGLYSREHGVDNRHRGGVLQPEELPYPLAEEPKFVLDYARLHTQRLHTGREYAYIHIISVHTNVLPYADCALSPWQASSFPNSVDRTQLDG